MGRRIIYKVENRPGNSIAETEWAELLKLQHWYNSEFDWSGGRLQFKRYVFFPNVEEFADLMNNIWEIIGERRQTLLSQGLSDLEIVSQLERDGLVSVKWGGYFDDCLASGFTRVADNEWNAFLVCDFLLKASTILSRATIIAQDEGRFIKTGKASFKSGNVFVASDGHFGRAAIEGLLFERRLFSIVDPSKYEKHPALRNTIPQFHQLDASERLEYLRNWNWLGYDDGYDRNGDDLQGFNLNLKVREFKLML
ncbi:MAG: hypothetical protein ACRDGA_11200 [Bacteroidota bacterium]